jgi:hypothetical protein
MMLQYRGGYYDNLGLIKTGITVGAPKSDRLFLGLQEAQSAKEPPVVSQFLRCECMMLPQFFGSSECMHSILRV